MNYTPDSSPLPITPPSPLERVKHYHQQTKHDFNRYARSLGYLDWANQPDPFRRFEGAPLVRLPLLKLSQHPVSPAYKDVYTPSHIVGQPLTPESLSRFFEYALSITAWKEYGGNRWALRSNPSSGNLHPTEGYVFLGNVPDLSLPPGVYHYAPKEHGLEQRLSCSDEEAQSILGRFPTGSFLVGLTSIHWREAWKYGERAFRYCQHDTGHAIGTLRIAAATLGWRLVVLAGTSDDTICSLLGIRRPNDFLDAEHEYPELIAVVWSPETTTTEKLPLFLNQGAVANLEQGSWRGGANRLSRDNPIPWEIIDDVTDASWKSSEEKEIIRFSPVSLPLSHPRGDLPAQAPETKAGDKGEEGTTREATENGKLLAAQIIHQRRSAVAFDGKTAIPDDRFFLMLSRLMPQPDLDFTRRPIPWDSIPWSPTIHLALFIHRVDGILPGLYLLIRSQEQEKLEDFKSSMHQRFLWTVPDGCPKDLPLYLLEDGNAQQIATQVSCWQEIAGESAFSLGMIADFDESIEKHGAWFYRRLFWETGLIGQVLYLEAEAAGVRATGIGCFFDDPFHRVFGLSPHTKYQSLYHFTVGRPVEDTRLTTLPPYGDELEK
jgi:SagB-type dehydrogenase family enzyme